jgi:hypothetical protein
MSTQLPSGPFVSALRLAAVPTAVGCARMFARHTLHAWRCPDVAEPATLITSELVTNAVTATGTTDPHPTYAALAAVPVVRVRLSLHNAALIIEVWDVSPEPPILRQQRENAEHGRGLLIVHEESELWGVYFPKTGGKVVWAEIALRKANGPPAAKARRPAPTRTTNPNLVAPTAA